jgi:RNA polymerase sigma factor (sigma-70 family)
VTHGSQTRSRTIRDTARQADLDGTVDLARDRELVAACQAGDQTAFAELYSRYHRRLLRFCQRRLHGSDDAEEAVQEAFTRAWRALPRFGGDRRFYPWLTVIAGNVCTDMLRRRSRVVPMDEMPLRSVELGDADLDEQLLRQVDLALATEALGHLSDRHQRVLRLREGTEWSAQRIAEHEGVAVPAVDTLLWRARQAFKREFAALTEAGGLAGIAGIGLMGVRRALARAGSRVASLASFTTRSPGTLAATVAIAGAAVAGGGVAIFHATTGHPVTAPPVAAPAPTTSPAGAGGWGALTSPGSASTGGIVPGRGVTTASRSVTSVEGRRVASVPQNAAQAAAAAGSTLSGTSIGGASVGNAVNGLGSTVNAVGNTVDNTVDKAVDKAVASVGRGVSSGAAAVGDTLGLGETGSPQSSSDSATPATPGTSARSTPSSPVTSVSSTAKTVVSHATTAVTRATRRLLGTL